MYRNVSLLIKKEKEKEERLVNYPILIKKKLNSCLVARIGLFGYLYCLFGYKNRTFYVLD
jgi:hypothetical protein